jgi:hypothetical protein
MGAGAGAFLVLEEAAGYWAAVDFLPEAGADGAAVEAEVFPVVVVFQAVAAVLAAGDQGEVGDMRSQFDDVKK